MRYRQRLTFVGTYEPFQAENDNIDTHQRFQRQYNPVILINEHAAVYPEHCEMYNQDDSEGNDEAECYNIL